MRGVNFASGRVRPKGGGKQKIYPSAWHKGLAKRANEYIMDNMFRDKKDTENNLKDAHGKIKDTSSSLAPYEAGGFRSGSYTKTDKLITALYMVTDIIDRDEPLRNKLRTLGTGIISDINSVPSLACGKIAEVMSFLDIASAVNIISEMNTSILRKEFLELDQSIKASTNNAIVVNRKIDLSEFFHEEEISDSHPSLLKGNSPSHGHPSHRLGVHKAGNLLKALKDIPASYEAGGFRSGSDKNLSGQSKGHQQQHGHVNAEHFDDLKKHRREDIVNIIKILGGSATIKDIKDKASSLPPSTGSLATCGEKTLQRELVSMVHDGVLNKTGEKRWSRYFVK